MVIVYKISDNTKQKMIEYYEDKKREKTPPYAVFQAEEAGTIITLYESGKVMFQGISADIDANMWREMEAHLNNGKLPEKLSTWPKYNKYVAGERYRELAEMLGLPASTIEEGVESYAKACGELGMRVGIKMNFKSQGIDEKEWLADLERLAYLAYEDQCSPVNPRVPLVKDMQEILKEAYYTEEFVNKDNK